MTDSLDWLRPHFNRISEEWWETTKMAFRLWPQASILTYNDVGKALQVLLGNRPDVRVERLDLEYQTYPREVFAEIIPEDKTNRSMARADFEDCDDFAWRFKANMRQWFNCAAIGFVIDNSAGHAYNIVVFADGTATLFEPQNDQFVKLDDPILGGIIVPPTSSGRYSLTNGIVVI